MSQVRHLMELDAMQQVQVQATTMYEADFGSLMSNAFSTV